MQSVHQPRGNRPLQRVSMILSFFLFWLERIFLGGKFLSWFLILKFISNSTLFQSQHHIEHGISNQSNQYQECVQVVWLSFWFFFSEIQIYFQCFIQIRNSRFPKVFLDHRIIRKKVPFSFSTIFLPRKDVYSIHYNIPLIPLCF